MEELHITAKTLDEAITEACVKLAVTSDCLDYTIVVHGTNGFFGIGAKPFEIIAKVKKTSPSESSARKDNKSVVKPKNVVPQKEPVVVPDNNDSSGKAPVIKNDSDNALKSDSAKISRSDDNAKNVTASTPENQVEIKELKHSEDKKNIPSRNPRGREPGSKDAPSSRNIHRDRQQRSEHSRHEVKADINRKPLKREPVAPAQSGETQVEIPEKKPFVLMEDPSLRAESFLTNLFNGLETKINYSGIYDEGSRTLTINLSGEDMGVLIGKRGQTLDALQYLTSQVVNKHQNGYIRVKIDTENYRERRKETLEQFAVNMAGRVRKNNHPVVLEPMNAYERRIIHSVLQSEKDIITRSEGEEPYRHIVICPVKKRRSRNSLN